MQLANEEIAKRKTVKNRPGEILVEMGFITPQQLEEALAEQKQTHLRIGEILVAQGWLTGVELTEALAQRLGVRFVDLGALKIDASAANLLTEKDARRYSAVPISYVNDHTMLVAMVDPANIFAIDDLRILTGYDIEPAIATEE